MAIYLGTNRISPAGTNGGFMLNGHLLTTKTYSFNLGQTNFSSITPTTSTQSLTLPATDYSSASTGITCVRVGKNYDGTVIDSTAHDYYIFRQYIMNYNYGSNNVSGTIHPIRGTGGQDYVYGHYAYQVDSSTGITTNTYTYTGVNTTSTNPMLYQKADNTYAIATSQGIYGGSTVASYTTNSSGDYLNLKFSAFYVKYNDSYCPLAALQAINPANTIITITWEIYEGDVSAVSKIYSVYDLVKNI